MTTWCIAINVGRSGSRGLKPPFNARDASVLIGRTGKSGRLLIWQGHIRQYLRRFVLEGWFAVCVLYVDRVMGSRGTMTITTRLLWWCGFAKNTTKRGILKSGVLWLITGKKIVVQKNQ